MLFFSRLTSVAFMIAILLSGCKSTSQLDYFEEGIPLDTFNVMPDADQVYHPAETKYIDLIHTRLHLVPDWQKSRMNGRAELTFKPHFYAIDSVIFDAKGMDIKQVSYTNASGEKIPFSYDGTHLSLALGQTYSRDDTLTVFIEYVSKPDERKTRFNEVIKSDKGLYFINPREEVPGKPRQIWTQGEVESNSVWFPTVDAPNQKYSQEIFLTVDTSFVTVSNGLLKSSVVHNDGTRTDYWVQEKPHSPYLTMIYVGRSAVVKELWRDSVELSYYVDPEFEPYAQKIFDHTPEMLTFFSELLGYDFAWDKYAQIIVEDYVSGAMENSSAVIFGDFVQQLPGDLIDENNDWIVAHEMFHHWFGDLVTCESWANLPLNESFATYGEYLWYEHFYGRMRADYHLMGDLETYLADSEDGYNKPLIRYYYSEPDEMFDTHSYQKGGAVLHMLRKYVGDEAFFESLKLYLHGNAFRNAEINNLRMAFEEVTGEDLHWFFDQWFFQIGHPVLVIDYEWDEETGTQYIWVEQTQVEAKGWELFRFPVYIDFYVNGEVLRKKAVVDSLSQVLSFEMPARPDLVIFDAERSLLCQRWDFRTKEECRFQYFNAPLFEDKLMAINYAVDLEYDSLVFAALFDTNEYVLMYILESGYPYDLDEKFNKRVLTRMIDIANNSRASMNRAKAIEYLYDMGYIDENMAGFYVNKLNDSSYSVKGHALTGLGEVNASLALEEAEDLENIRSSTLDFFLADLYSNYGTAEQESFFIDRLNRLSADDVGYFLTYYSAYLQLIDDPAVQKRGLAMVERSMNDRIHWVPRYYGVRVMKELENYYLDKAGEYEKLAEEQPEKEMIYKNLSAEYASLAAYAQETLKAHLESEPDGRVHHGQ